MPDQADVDRWAALVTTAYAGECVPPLSPAELSDLMAELDDPLAQCIMLAVSQHDWGPDYVNPVLDRWEARMRRRRGQRLGAVNYALNSFVME